MAEVPTSEIPVSDVDVIVGQSSQPQSVIWSVGSKNNMCAYLNEDTRNALSFAGIIKFLKRSRIYKAISTECVPYLSHVSSFWQNARVVRADTKIQIHSTVLGVDVMIDENVIREVIGFEDSAGMPTMLNKYLVRGLFLRVKYDGEIEKGVITKSGLSVQYKYLCHVLQHCLSPRRAGHDQMRETTQSAFAALVLNIPYNFSGMILQHMVENLETKKLKYLMYTRFVQMILDVKVPTLPKNADDVIKLEIMNDTTMGRLITYKSKEVKPVEKRLIGHLADSEYVFPGGKKWRHDDSDSDVEDIVVPQQPDADEGFNDEDVEVIPAVSPVVGGSSSQAGLRDEDDVDMGADEIPLVRKRKDPPAAKSLGDILREKENEKWSKRFKALRDILREREKEKEKSSKRFKPVKRSDIAQKTIASTTAPVPPVTVPHSQQGRTSEPIMTTATTTTTTAEQSSSSMQISDSAQLSVLNAMLLKVLAKQHEQDEEIQRLNAVVAKGEVERAAMSNTIKDQKLLLDSQKLLLEDCSNKNKKLELITAEQSEKIKKLEEDYNQLQDNMIVGEDRIFGLKDSGDASSEPSVEGSESTDSDNTGVIQFSIEYDKEEGAKLDYPKYELIWAKLLFIYLIVISSDRFTALAPNPVNALLKLDEDRVIVGTENGLISLVGILPNRVIQPIAKHSEYPVERLAFSHDRKLLGSVSHDSILKLWDIDSLLQDSGKKTVDGKSAADSDDDDDEMDMDSHDIAQKPSKGTKRKNNGKAQGLDNTSDFFADL